MALLRSKRYMTGIDWSLHSMNHANRRATGKGMVSRVVLELDTTPDEDALREILTRSANSFPLLQGTVARGLNLVPYWSTPRSPRNVEVPFETVSVTDDADLDEILHRDEGLLTEAGMCPYLRFRLAASPRAARLMMIFDHRLLDAQGAEAFLDYCLRDPEDQARIAGQVAVAEPSHLSEWFSKLDSARVLGNELLDLRNTARPRRARAIDGSGPKTFRFRVISLDSSQTERLIDAVQRQAGYLMIMPFILAKVMRVSNDILGRCFDVREHYAVPLFVNLRKPGEMPAKMFFNHLSFIFLRVRAEDTDDMAGMISSFKSQMGEQLASQFYQRAAEGLMLARILPIPLMSWLMRLYSGGCPGSLCFAVLADTGFTVKSFMGCNVKDLYHLPNPLYPPGIGVFFNVFEGRINGVFSYADNVIDEDIARRFATELQKELLSV